jgi:hypothetical protein
VDRLARDVAAVGPTDLHARFAERGAPSELRVVIGRLNGLLARLQSAFERERAFTANAAHELRTPIATLKVLAEVGLREAAADPARGREVAAFCGDALDVARGMERLTANLLGLARSQSGAQPIHIERVDLAECIEGAWGEFAREAERRGLRCELRLAPGAEVQTDETLLKAVLRNLFSNAVSHAAESSALAATLGEEEGRLVFSLANECGDLTQADLEHLFEPFWRKETSRADPTHCGIGLSLVAAFCRLLGVEVEADLTPPTLFRIELRFPPVGDNLNRRAADRKSAPAKTETTRAASPVARRRASPPLHRTPAKNKVRFDAAGANAHDLTGSIHGISSNSPSSCGRGRRACDRRTAGRTEPLRSLRPRRASHAAGRLDRAVRSGVKSGRAVDRLFDARRHLESPGRRGRGDRADARAGLSLRAGLESRRPSTRARPFRFRRSDRAACRR